MFAHLAENSTVICSGSAGSFTCTQNKLWQNLSLGRVDSQFILKIASSTTSCCKLKKKQCGPYYNRSSDACIIYQREPYPRRMTKRSQAHGILTARFSLRRRPLDDLGECIPRTISWNFSRIELSSSENCQAKISINSVFRPGRVGQ